jgi:hypothetical protein
MSDDTPQDNLFYVLWWIVAALVVATILAAFLTGCATRRVAVEVPEYDELSQETPTSADLAQAAREAIDNICKAHPHTRGCHE